MAVLWELSDLCHSREDNLYLYMLSKQGIVDSTGTEFWQIFSRRRRAHQSWPETGQKVESGGLIS